MQHSPNGRGHTRYVPALIAAAVAATLVAGCGGKTSNTMGMWIANGTNVVEYAPNQLMGGTSMAVPHLMNNSGSFGAPQGVTFDSKGNLWVMDPQAMVNGNMAPALLEFSPMQLAGLGSMNTPTPVATITSGALNFPQQSVFDKAGNQWVTDHNNNTVLVFTAAQLAMTGVNDLTPAVTITSANATNALSNFNGPLGIVFDKQGDLFIANNGAVTDAAGNMSAPGTSIVVFLAAHLPAVPTNGTPTTTDLAPDYTLTDTGGTTIQEPWALQFDASGNLFSSNAANPNTIVAFMASSLMMNGSPTPFKTISPTTVGGNMTLVAPNGICFDNAGDLAAVSSAAPFGLAFYNNPLPNGAATPSTFIAPGDTVTNGQATTAGSTLNAPAGCNFGPLH